MFWQRRSSASQNLRQKNKKEQIEQLWLYSDELILERKLMDIHLFTNCI